MSDHDETFAAAVRLSAAIRDFADDAPLFHMTEEEQPWGGSEPGPNVPSGATIGDVRRVLVALAVAAPRGAPSAMPGIAPAPATPEELMIPLPGSNACIACYDVRALEQPPKSAANFADTFMLADDDGAPPFEMFVHPAPNDPMGHGHVVAIRVNLIDYVVVPRSALPHLPAHLFFQR